MILFFDTSALIKRYINEKGSFIVDELFMQAKEIVLAPVTKIECFSTIKRLYKEKYINISQFHDVEKNLNYDFKSYSILNLNDSLEKRKHRFKPN